MTISNIIDDFLITEVELVYRNRNKAKERPKICDAESAYTLLMQKWDMNKIELVEQFYVLLLDRQSRCMGISHIATGGYAQCVVDPKIVFALALKSRASSLIVAHNHPSGETKPSFGDIDITRRLVEVGKALTLPVVDHLIVTTGSYLSFANEALIS